MIGRSLQACFVGSGKVILLLSFFLPVSSFVQVDVMPYFSTASLHQQRSVIMRLCAKSRDSKKDDIPDKKHPGSDHSTPPSVSPSNKPNNNSDDPQSLDDFLDTPFFDPNLVDENSPEWQQQLAKWIETDYNTVELVVSSAFFLVFIVLSQELLRMQFYGDHYEPFRSSVLPGKLF